MEELVNFLCNWGGLLKNLAIISSCLWGFYNLIRRIDKIKEEVSKIPDMTNKISKLQREVEKVSDLQDSVEKIDSNLKEHCKRGEKKDRLTLDMSRQTLLNEIEGAINEGWASFNKKTVLSELYESYTQDGGNGTIKALWKTYLALPTVKPAKKKNDNDN